MTSEETKCVTPGGASMRSTADVTKSPPEKNKTNETIYSVKIDGGDGGWTEILAESPDEAWTKAVEWAEEGNWWTGETEVEPVTVRLSVEAGEPEGEGEDEYEGRSEYITITPPEPSCLDECGHEWEGGGGYVNNVSTWRCAHGCGWTMHFRVSKNDTIYRREEPDYESRPAKGRGET